MVVLVLHIYVLLFQSSAHAFASITTSLLFQSWDSYHLQSDNALFSTYRAILHIILFFVNLFPKTIINIDDVKLHHACYHRFYDIFYISSSAAFLCFKEILTTDQIPVTWSPCIVRSFFCICIVESLAMRVKDSSFNLYNLQWDSLIYINLTFYPIRPQYQYFWIALSIIKVQNNETCNTNKRS